MNSQTGFQRLRAWRADAIVLALIFTGAFVFFTRDASFPFYGHPDEPGKAEQVLTGKRNYNHPLLMLNSAALVNGVLGNKDDYNRAALAGRWVVAGYAAGAVTILALLAVRLLGNLRGWMRWLALVASGTIMASTPQLFEFAKYFKEDPVFCFGLAAFLLAADFFGTRPSRNTLVALAIGMALAVSSKYLGVIVLPLGFWLIWRHARSSGWWPYRVPAWAAALGIFLVVFFLINYQAVRGFAHLTDSVVSETQKAVDRPDGISRPIPNNQGWRLLVATTSGVIWLFLLAALSSLVMQWRRRRVAEVFLVLIPLILGITICFSDKMAERYFLPCSTLISCFAGIGLFRLARWGCHRVEQGREVIMAALVVVGTVLVLQSRAPSLSEIAVAHEGDPRKDLAVFVRDHLPPTACILSDKRVRLPNATQPENDVYHLNLPQQVLLAPRSQFAADFASFEELKAKGVTHVALCEPDYGRFFVSGTHPITSTDPSTLARITFYRKVLTQGRLVWQSPAREINIVWPGLRLYELP